MLKLNIPSYLELWKLPISNVPSGSETRNAILA